MPPPTYPRKWIPSSQSNCRPFQPGSQRPNRCALEDRDTSPESRRDCSIQPDYSQNFSCRADNAPPLLCFSPGLLKPSPIDSAPVNPQGPFGAPPKIPLPLPCFSPAPTT